MIRWVVLRRVHGGALCRRLQVMAFNVTSVDFTLAQRDPSNRCIFSKAFRRLGYLIAFQH